MHAIIEIVWQCDFEAKEAYPGQVRARYQKGATIQVRLLEHSLDADLLEDVLLHFRFKAPGSAFKLAAVRTPDARSKSLISNPSAL